MAKLGAEVEEEILVDATPAQVYKFLWDVVGSSRCITGLDRCEKVGKDTYRFVYQERSKGPVRMTVTYTARYQGNGKDEIQYEGTESPGDNTSVRGTLRVEPAGKGSTRVVLRQLIAPETPVPRLMHGLFKSYVESEARAGVQDYLRKVKAAVEKKKA